MLDMPAVSSSVDVTVQMRARRLPQQQRRQCASTAACSLMSGIGCAQTQEDAQFK